jgi:hypothetical protein
MACTALYFLIIAHFPNAPYSHMTSVFILFSHHVSIFLNMPILFLSLHIYTGLLTQICLIQIHAKVST